MAVICSEASMDLDVTFTGAIVEPIVGLLFDNRTLQERTRGSDFARNFWQALVGVVDRVAFTVSGLNGAILPLRADWAWNESCSI